MEMTLPAQLWIRCVLAHAPPELPLNEPAFLAMLTVTQAPEHYPPEMVTECLTTLQSAGTIVTHKLASIGIFPDSLNVQLPSDIPPSVLKEGFTRVYNLHPEWRPM